VAVVDGWWSVEELTRRGFAQSPVVMANEAHNGLARCIRTRAVGVRMIEAAHQAGVRDLAMEALPRPEDRTPGPIWAVPEAQPLLVWSGNSHACQEAGDEWVPMGHHFRALSDPTFISVTDF